jgi:hypothetical protein
MELGDGMAFDDAVIWLRLLRLVNPLFDEMGGWDPPDFGSAWAEGGASGKARVIISEDRHVDDGVVEVTNSASVAPVCS